MVIEPQGVRFIVNKVIQRNIIPELHLVTEDFLGWSLVFVEQNVLMMTTMETSLVRVHPAGWVPLLQEVAFK